MRCVTLIFAFMFLNSFIFSESVVKENDLKKIYEKGRIELAETVSIGADNLPTDVLLGSMADFAITRNGNVFVCDNQSNNLKLFDQNGRFIRVVGQKGKGPGDFDHPFRIETDGQRVLINSSGKRTSVFDQNGNYVAEFTTGVFSRMGKMRFLPSGHLVVQTQKNNAWQGKSQEIWLHLLNADLSGDHVIFKQNVNLYRYIVEPRRFAVRQPFQPTVSWDVSPDGKIYIGFQDMYQIRVYEPGNGFVSVLSHTHTPVLVSDADKEAYFADSVIATNEGITRKTPSYITDNATFAGHKPVFENLMVDGQGNLFVFLFLAHGEEHLVADVFGPDGAFFCQVRFGRKGLRSERMKFSGEFLWALVLDDDGEDVLKKFMMK